MQTGRTAKINLITCSSGRTGQVYIHANYESSLCAANGL